MGVGSLACALGPGGSEAPEKPAKAGLEQRPAGRCGASRGLGHGSGLSKTEPKIQTLSHLGVWLVLSESKGTSCSKKNHPLNSYFGSASAKADSLQCE